MNGEHLIYSAATAIFIGMLYLRVTGRDHSWIIILFAFIPDLDKIINPIVNLFGLPLLLTGHTIRIGTFHNIGMMLVITAMTAVLLYAFGINLVDSLFFSIIGFGAHLLEDILVYPQGYRILIPFYRGGIGSDLFLGMLSIERYTGDLLHIANITVLLVGLCLLIIVIIIRTSSEGPAWIRYYLPDAVYQRISRIFPELNSR